MTKNGTIAKWILVSIAVAGILWNAAVLHNDVGHLKDELTESNKRTEKRFDKLEFQLEKIRILFFSK